MIAGYRIAQTKGFYPGWGILANLNNTPVTDAALPGLGKLQRLRVLDLSGTGVSREAMRQLRLALPQRDVAHS